MVTTIITVVTLVAASYVLWTTIRMTPGKAADSIVPALLTGVWAMVMFGAMLWTVDTTLVISELAWGTWGVHAAALAISVLFCAWAITRRLAHRRVMTPRIGQKQSFDALVSALAHSHAAATDLDSMLADAASVIRRFTGADCVHLCKTGAQSRRHIATCSANPRSIAHSGYDAESDRMVAAASNSCDIGVYRAMHGAPDMIAVPCADAAGCYAVMVLQQPQPGSYTDTALGQLHAAGQMLGRFVSDWIAAHRGLTSGRVAEPLSWLSLALSGQIGLSRGVAQVAVALHDVVDFHYLSLAAVDGSLRHEDRISMVPGERRIVESRKRWPMAATTRRVRATARILNTPDLRESPREGHDEKEPWECRLGMRTRLVLPLSDGSGTPLGALTIAHRQPAQYDETTVALLQPLCSVIGLWLSGLAQRNRNQRAEAASRLAGEMLSAPMAWQDDTTMLQSVRSIVPSAAIRLLQLGADGDTLTEIASTGRVRTGPAVSPMRLSQLPWHRSALQAHGVVHVDQDDPESHMDQTESQQVGINLRTAAIIPICAGQQVLGFVDVVEVRDPDRTRLGRVDDAVLTALSHAIRYRWVGMDVNAPPPQPAGRQHVAGWSEFCRDIINPITCIVGSAELIRYKQPSLCATADRHLETIVQSATRIQDLLATYVRGNGLTALTPDPAHARNNGAKDHREVGQATGDNRVFQRPASVRVPEPIPAHPVTAPRLAGNVLTS